MKIYLSHSRSFDYKQELYEPIKASQLIEKHEFIFPHEKNDALFPTRELLQNKGCDVIIAEVSHPATGQGIELGWASMLDIPIICIYKDGAKPASSLNEVTSKFLMYTDAQNMIEDITGVLKQYE
jgi:nucleoside 2-deoxyribosyltransferase